MFMLIIKYSRFFYFLLPPSFFSFFLFLLSSFFSSPLLPPLLQLNGYSAGLLELFAEFLAEELPVGTLPTAMN